MTQEAAPSVPDAARRSDRLALLASRTCGRSDGRLSRARGALRGFGLPGLLVLLRGLLVFLLAHHPVLRFVVRFGAHWSRPTGPQSRRAATRFQRAPRRPVVAWQRCRGPSASSGAGAFANALDVRNAVAIGLLAPVPVERARRVGNASVRGAKVSSPGRAASPRARGLLARIEHVEPESEPDFFDLFVDGCRFAPLPATVDEQIE